MLTRLLGRFKQGDAPAELAYENQKQLVQSKKVQDRLKLAESEATKPEILYYLANDDAPDVRRAVALNPRTPVQADIMLAKDEDDEVRSDLALKIGRLIPELPNEEQIRVRELTIETLEMLAEDQLPRVRAAIAEEIKSTPHVPKKIIHQLAKDIHIIVSAPILEYSPLLADEDLIEIIAAGTASDALSAIARRDAVSTDVSDAVVATLDVPAVASLLANKSAQIREDTLDIVIDHAEEITAWHEPMILRPELSVRAARRIASFVASSLVETLAEKHSLPSDLVDELLGGVRKRLNESTGEVQDDAKARAKQLFQEGNLDEEKIEGAMEAADQDFCFEALALMSGLSSSSITRIFGTRNGELITSLAWKSGLSMRNAMRLQSQLGKVAPQSLVNARNGTDFPMADDHMEVLLGTYE